MLNLKTLIVASLLSTTAFAAELKTPDYKQFYLVNGKQAEASNAILSALSGNEVFRCQSVAASLSKSGTSIGIKNVKKLRVAKN